MTVPDDRFALFDADDGGALLLSDYRRTICLDTPGGDPASLFAQFADESARGNWLALAADYELGRRFEPAVAKSAAATKPELCAWVFEIGRAHV